MLEFFLLMQNSAHCWQYNFYKAWTLKSGSQSSHRLYPAAKKSKKKKNFTHCPKDFLYFFECARSIRLNSKIECLLTLFQNRISHCTSHNRLGTQKISWITCCSANDFRCCRFLYQILHKKTFFKWKKSFQIESFNTWCRVYLEENICFSNIGYIFSSVTGEKIRSQYFIIEYYFLDECT